MPSEDSIKLTLAHSLTMGRFRILGFLALMVLPSSITALSTAAHGLFERASCANSSDIQCSGLPSGYCCGSSSTCLIFANNTSLLCCPTNEDCTTISPISCDISLQNITSHPQSGLYTTNLTATLPSCGSQCCPLGFSCTGSQCTLATSQASSPSHTSSSSGTATATTAPVVTSTPATVASPAVTTDPSVIQQGCNAFPAEAIVAGFFPGLVAGALFASAAFCLLGAHRRKQARLSGSFGKVSASISDPIYQEGSAIRTDFIRKQTSAPSTPTRQPTLQRVRSLFRKSAAANGTEMAIASSPGAPSLPQAAPRTPRLQREPSGESINIFADPSTASEGIRGRDSHQTTFTDMMERADLAGVRKGEPFVPRLSPKAYNSLPRGGPR